MHTCTHSRIHTHSHTFAHIRTHSHTLTHSHTQVCARLLLDDDGETPPQERPISMGPHAVHVHILGPRCDVDAAAGGQSDPKSVVRGGNLFIIYLSSTTGTPIGSILCRYTIWMGELIH